MAGSAEGVQPAAFDTGLSAPTCEAVVALLQLGDMHTPTTCLKELTEHSLLLPEGPELETHMPSACGCYESRTVPTRECTKWRTSGALYWGVKTIMCQ